MTNKMIFINEVLALTENAPETTFSPEALEYWNYLNKPTEDKEKIKFTENGKMILDFIKKNKDQYNNSFKAKDIGEGLGISSRTASGSLRKLITDGYIEKVGESPVSYSLTSLGEQTDPYAE